MLLEALPTLILGDSVRRLAQVAAWHRRQGGKHADGHVRIANTLTTTALERVAMLRTRAEDGDEQAVTLLQRLPHFGLQAPLGGTG